MYGVARLRLVFAAECFLAAIAVFLSSADGATNEHVRLDAAIESSGLYLAVNYPTPLTYGAFDVFAGEDLVVGTWTQLVTLTPDPGTNRVQWFHAGALDNTARRRYYLVGTDCDLDGDLLWDAREMFIHRTCPTNCDTDKDGILDGEELLLNGTDPLNADTRPPVVQILCPSNGFRRIWIP